MKKLWVIVAVLLTLTGCSVATDFETVNDELFQVALGRQKEVYVALPSDAASPVVNMEDGGRLYFCDGYTLTVQTMLAGDMDRTARQLCGYGIDALTVVKTESGGLKRTAWAWSSAGEAGDQVGRAMVLDDGDYHYCVCFMADAASAGALETVWMEILGSVRLT